MDKYKYLLLECLLRHYFIKEKYFNSLNIQKVGIGKIVIITIHAVCASIEHALEYLMTLTDDCDLMLNEKDIIE